MRSSDPLRLTDIRRTTTFRLALLFGLLSTIGTVMLVGLIYLMTARELTRRSDDILHREAARLVLIPSAALPAQIDAEIARNVHGLDHFALIGGNGDNIAGNLRAVPGLRDNHPIDVDANAEHGPMRLLAVRTARGETILLGRDISEIRLLLGHILDILVGSSLTITPAVLLIGGVLSLGPLRHVQQIRQASGRIAAGQLQVRMPLAGRNDEFDQIATTVNAMIENVERVVAQVKSVTDAIAHDLRTPLTHVRTELDRARSVAGLPIEYRRVTDELVGDLDLVLDRFAALLRISELEASERRAGFTLVEVDTLVSNLIDLYRPVAEEKGVAIDVEILPSLTLHADGKLLFEALANLLDNAIKFAERRVRVEAYRQDGVVLIAVRDDGPGVPVEEREAVLRRFYRRDGDQSRPGVGLGLSIVSAILHIHQFGLEMEGDGPGLLVKIRTSGPEVIRQPHENENSRPSSVM